MPLTEKSIISKIEILEDGQIQIQRANLVLRDGIEIAREYHRHVLEPGADLAPEDARVAAVATTVWIPKVLSDWTQSKATRAAALKLGS